MTSRVPTLYELKSEGYVYDQSESNIHITFLVDKNLLKRNVEVDIQANSVVGGVKGKDAVIKGKLYASIVKEKSFWNLVMLGDSPKDQYQVVSITLTKHVKASQWPVLITSPLVPGQPTDPKSTFLLGQLADGVLPAKAKELYTKSAEMNHLPALLRLAEIYELGNNIMQKTQDKSLALKFYEKAAQLGNLTALMYCGNCYLNGNDVIESDKLKALNYYLKINELMDKDQLLPSVDSIICIDLNGKIRIESNKPIDPIFISNTLIYTTSLYLSSQLLLQAPSSIQPNPNLALTNLNKSIQFQHILSYLQLGSMYYDGITVDRDIIRSYTYYQTAKKLDDGVTIPIRVKQEFDELISTYDYNNNDNSIINDKQDEDKQIIKEVIDQHKRNLSSQSDPLKEWAPTVLLATSILAISYLVFNHYKR